MKKFLLTLSLGLILVFSAQSRENHESLSDILDRYKAEGKLTEEEYDELSNAWLKDVKFLREKYLSKEEPPPDLNLPVTGEGPIETIESPGLLQKQTKEKE